MSRYSLPEITTDETQTVEQVIDDRESIRSFTDQSLALSTVSKALWAAQGVTHNRDKQSLRAVPSAGATYPLETLLEVPPTGVTDLPAGLYRYDPATHSIEQQIEGSLRPEFIVAGNNQPAVRNGRATIILAADFDRTTREYPDHGRRYVHMEAGHAAQNIHLLCVAEDVATCAVGAFDDEELHTTLQLDEHLDPLYMIPMGIPHAD